MSIRRNPQEDDRFVWKSAASGSFIFSKDTYWMLCQGNIRFSMYAPIRRSLATLKCKNFCWLAIIDCLWTSDRRYRRRLQNQASVCCTCLQDEDTFDHILVQCSYVMQIWYDCIHAAGLEMEEPHANSQLESWWT
jgi:hypothetical protein